MFLRKYGFEGLTHSLSAFLSLPEEMIVHIALCYWSYLAFCDCIIYS